MWVVTAAQMRERDRWAIEEVGLPGLVLMENAGRQVAALARRLLDEGGAGKKAWIFAGKGNNGGDGLVAARYLARAGVQVETFLLARE
ncbi:MAG: NAD(P)H-hydrate epimerase, partial [bacterium]